MSYHEKENIVNIFSSLLITAVFALGVYQRQLDGRIDLTENLSSWGKIFLIFIGVSIVARIIIMIVFNIINTIATREEKIPAPDERDRLIKLKSTRNSYYTFSSTIWTGFIFLAVGLPVYWLFLIFILSGLIAELVDNGSQLYYHRKGV